MVGVVGRQIMVTGWGVEDILRTLFCERPQSILVVGMLQFFSKS